MALETSLRPVADGRSRRRSKAFASAQGWAKDEYRACLCTWD